MTELDKQGTRAAMNLQQPIDANARPAVLRYMPGEFVVVSPGKFVRCAVTARPIALEELRYWSHEVQEPYASAEIAFQRHEQLKAEGKL